MVQLISIENLKPFSKVYRFDPRIRETLICSLRFFNILFLRTMIQALNFILFERPFLCDYVTAIKTNSFLSTVELHNDLYEKVRVVQKMEFRSFQAFLCLYPTRSPRVDLVTSTLGCEGWTHSMILQTLLKIWKSTFFENFDHLFFTSLELFQTIIR